MLLVSLVKAYAVRRAIRPNTTQFYHRCARQLSRHVGHPATVEDLPHLNELLAAKQQRRPAYRKSLRTGLVALWRFAAEAGLAAEPQHVAPVRLPAAPVHTWSQTEVERLRAHAERIRGPFIRSTMPRGRYWHTLIGAAWYTGLSLVDLRRIALADIGPGGNLAAVRSKTGRLVLVGLPPEEVAAVVAYHAIAGRGTGPLWPRWGSEEAFRRAFGHITRAAGLAGPWKTLRASAGTAFELAHPGQGHLFLGNSRDVFLRNYYDPRREPATLPHAPRLGRLG